MPLPRPCGAHIRVWRIALDDWTSLTPARLAWLDPREWGRAERFYGEAHAQRWRVAHVAVRAILAEELDRDPGSLQFTVGGCGKPALVGAADLAFNLSHSADIAVLAVGGRDALGVDVEHVTDAPDLADIAATCFAADERADLAALDPPERVHAFYRCWTRKEAVVKALGVGVGFDLRTFSVSLGTEAPRLRRVAPPMPAAECWTLRAIELRGPYVGAVAVPHADANVNVVDWIAR